MFDDIVKERHMSGKWHMELKMERTKLEPQERQLKIPILNKKYPSIWGQEETEIVKNNLNLRQIEKLLSGMTKDIAEVQPMPDNMFKLDENDKEIIRNGGWIEEPEVDVQFLCMHCACVVVDNAPEYKCPNCNILMDRFDNVKKKEVDITGPIENAVKIYGQEPYDESYDLNPIDDKVEYSWGDNPFAEARHTMAEYFNTDDDLYHSYQANIAMFLNDECNITNHEKRNYFAKKLMSLLWQ